MATMNPLAGVQLPAANQGPADPFAGVELPAASAPTMQASSDPFSGVELPAADPYPTIKADRGIPQAVSPLNETFRDIGVGLIQGMREIGQEAKKTAYNVGQNLLKLRSNVPQYITNAVDDSMSTMTNQINQQRQQFLSGVPQEKRSAIEGYTKTFALGLPALFTAGISAGPRLASQIGVNAGQGALMGALAPSSDRDKVQAAIIGGLVGGATGALAPQIPKLASAAVRGVSNLSSGVSRYVGAVKPWVDKIDDAARLNPDSIDVQKAAKEFGIGLRPDQVLDDPLIQQQLSHLSMASDADKMKIISNIKMQDAQAQKALEGVMGKISKSDMPDLIPKMRQAVDNVVVGIHKQAETEAGPLYQGLKNIPISPEDFQQIQNLPRIKEATAKAFKLGLTKQNTMTMEGMDKIKQGYDDLVSSAYRSGDDKIAAFADKQRRTLTEMLDNIDPSGTYKEARRLYNESYTKVNAAVPEHVRAVTESGIDRFDQMIVSALSTSKKEMAKGKLQATRDFFHGLGDEGRQLWNNAVKNAMLHKANMLPTDVPIGYKGKQIYKNLFGTPAKMNLWKEALDGNTFSGDDLQRFVKILDKMDNKHVSGAMNIEGLSANGFIQPGKAPTAETLFGVAKDTARYFKNKGMIKAFFDPENAKDLQTILHTNDPQGLANLLTRNLNAGKFTDFITKAKPGGAVQTLYQINNSNVTGQQ